MYRYTTFCPFTNEQTSGLFPHFGYYEHTYVSVWMNYDFKPGTRTAGSYGNSMLNLSGNVNLFHRLHHLTFPPAIYEGSNSVNP